MRGLRESFFQSGKEPEYSGPERRTDRIKLSEEGEALVDAIAGRLLGSCRDNCVIPREAHSHVPHMVGTVKEIGNDSIPNGINKMRDQYFENHKLHQMNRTIKDIIVKTVITLFITSVLGVSIYGIAKKLQVM